MSIPAATGLSSVTTLASAAAAQNAAAAARSRGSTRGQLNTQPNGQLNTQPNGKPNGQPISKARHAMQQLEAQILGDWLESLQKAFALPGGDSDPAVSENYRYLTTQALAGNLATHGGLGIGTMLLHSLHLEDEKNSSPKPNVQSLPADGNR